MRRLQNEREGVARAACLAVLFVLLFLLCRLFPVTGDDWFREALGASIHTPAGLLREVAVRWATINGRVLGNVLAYTAGSRPLVRDAMRTLFTLLLIDLLARTARLEGWQGVLLCAAGVLAVPREMFAQIYPWSAGFFNYVPPVVMLLACLVLTRAVPEGGRMEESPARGTALFLLGFGQQLFIENNTLCALCLSLALAVWYRLERRRLSPCLLAFFLGCALGAGLLFASPSYRLISGTDGAYQSGLGGGLAGLVSAARANLPEVARYFILDCPILYFGLTILTLRLAVQLGRRAARMDWLLLAMLALGAMAMYWEWPAVTGAAAVWYLALAAAMWRWLPDRASRAEAIFLWLGAAVAAGPLLFVNPIGPRCLFLSYVLMLAMAGILLRAPGRGPVPAAASGVAAVLTAAAVFAFYAHVYLPLYRTERVRTELLTAAVAAGEQEAVLPAYDHGGYLWDADNAKKMEQFYYRSEPGDLKISFVSEKPGKFEQD